MKPKPVNKARFDKLGSYWKRWAVDPRNRCLIPTAGYAVAVGEPGRMTETWLKVRDQPIFAWAGLWSISDEWGAVYTGVMTDNAPELIDIHERSPVILDPADWDTWLHAPLEDLYQFDRPYPGERMVVEHTDREANRRDQRYSRRNCGSTLRIGKSSWKISRSKREDSCTLGIVIAMAAATTVPQYTSPQANGHHSNDQRRE